MKENTRRILYLQGIDNAVMERGKDFKCIIKSTVEPLSPNPF
jgi:hypothetical protein